MNIQKDVKELLEELNEIGESKIFGGYIRDLFTSNKPSDVDIVTNIPIEVIAEKYKNMEKAKQRKTTNGHDVFSFKLHRAEKIFVEIISTNQNLLNKAYQADYTINSLLHDGYKIIDLTGGLKDIKNKLIREVDTNIIENDLKCRPYLWLKTLRLVSMTGFDLSSETYHILNGNKECINEISREIMQNEGHKTMNGKDPLKAMKILSLMGFINPFEKGVYLGDLPLQSHQKLVLLAVLSNKQSVDDFIKFYQFQQHLIDKYEYLYRIYTSSERPPSRFKNQIITIKKIINDFKD